MPNSLATLSACACALALAAGCAAPQPVPFQLVDAASKIHRGTMFPDTQRIDVTVDGQMYSGFYIVATGWGVSQPSMWWPHYAFDTVTTYTSNSARAHLTAAGGERLGCQFLIEGPRAVGECRSPDGKVFQLVAEGR